MPIDLLHDKLAGILKVKLSGLVSVQEINSSLLQLVSSDDIPSDIHAIWDVSEMEFGNVTIDFQRELIDFRKHYVGVRGNAKIAILSQYSLADPLVKLYTILSKDLHQETKVFIDEDSARQWLSE